MLHVTHIHYYPVTTYSLSAANYKPGEILMLYIKSSKFISRLYQLNYLTALVGNCSQDETEGGITDQAQSACLSAECCRLCF